MTPEGARLLETYRQAQVRLATETARTAIAIWPFLLRGDQARWLALMLGLIRRDRTSSAVLARQYMQAYRLIERAGGNFGVELPDPVEEEQIISSMIVTGPLALERARQKAGVDRLANQGGIARKIMESNARAAQRHVLNGGRRVVDDVLERDPSNSGYMRVTDGNPCYFCAMLASRGPVYKDDSFEDSDPRFSGAGDHKVHDGCACQIVPIYGSGIVPLTQFKAYERLWQTSTQGASGKEAVRRFRRAYEQQRR